MHGALHAIPEAPCERREARTAYVPQIGGPRTQHTGLRHTGGPVRNTGGGTYGAQASNCSLPFVALLGCSGSGPFSG
eukprot:15433772-Alexandrium_andersonii.AAC.1